MNPNCTVTKRANSFNDCLPPLKATILTLVLLSLAFGQQAKAGDNARHFHIPAQSLNNALMQLASEAKLELVFPADNVLGLKTSTLDGTMTVNQALNRLLQGSGITYHLIDARTVTLERMPASLIKTGNTQTQQEPQSNSGEGQVMPKVTVEADADNPYDDPTWQTDPYNRDYVLPKATAGTKTNTPIMETPLNVQVISKQVLRDQQVIRLRQALKNVSGVTAGTAIGGSDRSSGITLRGFDSETFFRNGFRLQSGSANREFANVESVEVLKGPAAILYGLVEPGGMVNVTTKQPQATPYYAINQQFGSFDLYRTTADATGPLTKDNSLLYRMNFSYENSGSFQDFVYADDVFLAPIIRWNISPQTQVTLEMEYQHQNRGYSIGFVPFKNGKPIVPISTSYAEPNATDANTYFVGLNWSHQFNDDWSFKHQFTVNKTDGTYPSAYYPNSVDRNKVLRSNLLDFVGYSDTYATNLDLIGHFETLGLKHTLLMGGDYYRTDGRFRQEVGEDTAVVPSIDVFNPVHTGSPLKVREFSVGRENIADQYGLYLQDQIELPYQLFVMGGFRYQYIEQRGTFNLDFEGESISTVNDPQRGDAVTPRVGVLWQPQSWLSLYGNYVESFGQAGSGSIYPDRKQPPPTSAEQWEVGIKGEWFGGRLRASAAYYDLTKTNIVSPDPNPNHRCGGEFSPGDPSDCVVVTGAVRSRGPEIDITGEILPGWNVIANYAYTDIRIAETNADNVTNDNGLAVGDRFFGVPRHTANFWTTYEPQGGYLKGFQVGGGVNLQDSQTIQPDSAGKTGTIPGFVTVGLMAGYSFEVGKTKVSAQLNVDNLLDKRYYTAAIPADVTNSTVERALFVNFGAPRTFMGSINVEF